MVENANYRSKVTYLGTFDTWWFLDEECPKCEDGSVSTNGKIKDCQNCDWWEPIE